MNKELQFLIYNTPQEDIKVNVIMQDENIWLTQKAMAELFDIDRTGIGKHLKNIFASGELEEKLVCANFAHTSQHGAIPGKTQDKEVTYYNLDAIIQAIPNSKPRICSHEQAKLLRKITRCHYYENWKINHEQRATIPHI